MPHKQQVTILSVVSLAIILATISVARQALAAPTSQVGEPSTSSVAAATAAAALVDDPAYWLTRREQFFKNTTFKLSEPNRRLYGGKFWSVRTVHLPFWFDYELFKKVFNKSSAPTLEEERARHVNYLNECIRTMKKRVLFRMLAGTHDEFITEEADKFYWEKRGYIDGGSGANSDSNSNNNIDPKQDNEELSYSFDFNKQHLPLDNNHPNESPLERALNLVRAELDLVQNKNQLWHYLDAFNEVDGQAIAGKLPYN